MARPTTETTTLSSHLTQAPNCACHDYTSEWSAALECTMRAPPAAQQIVLSHGCSWLHSKCNQRSAPYAMLSMLDWLFSLHHHTAECQPCDLRRSFDHSQATDQTGANNARFHTAAIQVRAWLVNQPEPSNQPSISKGFSSHHVQDKGPTARTTPQHMAGQGGAPRMLP